MGRVACHDFRTRQYFPLLLEHCVLIGHQGLMIMLEENTSHAKQEIFILIAGIGIGCLFQPPLIGLQAAMPLKDMATATAAFGLVR